MSTVAGWFPATHIGLLLSTKNTCSDSPHSLLLSICLSLCVGSSGVFQVIANTAAKSVP